MRCVCRGVLGQALCRTERGKGKVVEKWKKEGRGEGGILILHAVRTRCDGEGEWRDGFRDHVFALTFMCHFTTHGGVGRDIGYWPTLLMLSG
jgi:hypothetical protein